MYGIPSGPVYTPELIKHPWKRPGQRVRVLPNNDICWKDHVGQSGTLVRTWDNEFTHEPYSLVYLDHSLDMNGPCRLFEPIPQGEHLFVMRNQPEKVFV